MIPAEYPHTPERVPAYPWHNTGQHAKEELQFYYLQSSTWYLNATLLDRIQPSLLPIDLLCAKIFLGRFPLAFSFALAFTLGFSRQLRLNLHKFKDKIIMNFKVHENNQDIFLLWRNVSNSWVVYIYLWHHKRMSLRIGDRLFIFISMFPRDLTCFCFRLLIPARGNEVFSSINREICRCSGCMPLLPPSLTFLWSKPIIHWVQITYSNH